jgi:hypothetical protein
LRRGEAWQLGTNGRKSEWRLKYIDIADSDRMGDRSSAKIRSEFRLGQARAG